jgi:hypothetical protein
MTREEANDIIYRDLEAEDRGCSCHISPPCKNCVERPTPEEVEEAKVVLMA